MNTQETIQQAEGGAAVRSSDLLGFPPVLDACCGARMFWYDKKDPRATFVDIRSETFTHVRTDCGNKEITVCPDQIADFTSLPFPDNTFALVVFDPPHVIQLETRGTLTKYYGVLNEDWRDMIRGGFSECFRVLRPEGTLIFKWAEVHIPIADVLALAPHKPLFGHKVGKRSKTHWCAFLKPNDQSSATTPSKT